MRYLDTASTVPLHPAAREVLLAAYDQGWADPARLHGAGRRARLLLDDARGRTAAALDVRPDEVHFCASGTAANRLALHGVLAARRRAGSHVVTSAVEHSSVLKAVPDATLVPVDRLGRVDPAEFAAALRPETVVASLQSANHEVGTVQPAVDTGGVPLHVDAAQSAGHTPLPRYDLLTASAHKWGGPAGVGLLVVRKGTRWRRTEAEDFPNVPAIVAAAVALEARLAEVADENERAAAWVDRIRAEVARIEDVEVVGDPVNRLPHVVTFSVLYVDGEALVTELDKRGIAVNSGSACVSDTLAPSHVLEAMGVLTHGNVRVSLGRDTTQSDVDALLAAIPDVVRALRP